MNSRQRLKSLQLLFSLSVFVVLSRLFYWQVVKAKELSQEARLQHSVSYEVGAERGRILANDSFPLVANEESYLFYADPQLVEESKNKIAASVAATLFEEANLSPEEKTAFLLNKENEIKEKLQRESRWTVLSPRISPQAKESLENLNFKGLGYQLQFSRSYPEGSSSAHLVGFVGQNEHGQQKGYFGIEGQYDLELKGRAGLLTREKDAFGRPIIIGDFYQEKKKDGRDIFLNLDRAIQRLVSQKLAEGLIRYGASEGSVVILNPQNGALIASASLPAYDPASFQEFSKGLYPNPVAAFAYEPGSTFKVLVTAAALNEDVIKKDTLCSNCAGPRVIDGYTIRTWNDRYYPETTVTDILVHSDNIGMIFIAESLGLKNFYRYLESFGFGQKTGVDLEEEAGSGLRPISKWANVDLATASFGQGIAVTPLQMVRAVSAIANGGYLVTPQVAREIIDAGERMPVNLPSPKRILKNETCQQLTEIMVEAVDRGEAQWAKPVGYRIAGKTGTAQIPVAGHYDEEKTIASFVGFAPADNPLFTMLVILREPTTSPWGSETAAPLWFEIAKELFIYYGVGPN